MSVSVGILLVAFAGCNASTNQPCSVSGQATFEGKPIEKGAIRFVTHDQTPGPGGIGSITDGEYAITTPGMLSGTYLVMISGFKETGRKLVIDGTEVNETRQYVPSKYNSNSTYVVELSPGENSTEFDLLR